jgi:hypothetical protein
MNIRPQQVADNLGKEEKIRLIFGLSEAILGIKWAI